MENYNDMTDDEDFLELVELVLQPRAPRQYRRRPNQFEVWNEKQFRERFRLPKNIVKWITDKIAPEIRNKTNRNHGLSPSEMVLLTLRFLATGSFLQVIGDFIGVDKATACRTVHKVLRAIARLRPQFVNMPVTREGISRVKQGIYLHAGFPNCIGAIDCTHVKIQNPGGENAEQFRNRKQYFSYNVQAICDASLKFLNIVCRWPGAAHDSHIFANSRIRTRFESNDFGSDVIVGDSGYCIKPYLITPLRNPVTQAEHLFNKSQIKTRNLIERSFGILKRRFPVLALGIRLKHQVEAIVVACVVLHNIAIDMKDDCEFNYNEAVEAEIELTGNINPDVPEEYEAIDANNVVRYKLIDYFSKLL